MKKTLGALCAATLLAGALAPAQPATAAGALVTIKPKKLDRGDGVRMPHLEGKSVVDGDVRVRVRGKERYLLGSSGDGYVVQVRRHGRYETVRVEPGAKQKTLVQKGPGQVVLGADGSTIAVVDKLARRTSIDVRSAVDGSLLGTGDGFRGYPSVLDLDGDHMIVASFERGAVDYDWKQGTTTKITGRSVYRADISSNKMALFTDDPYDGGCTVVAPLTRPKKRLWRSCDEAVLSFSPNARRMVTTFILADGLGPNQVTQRALHGRLVATYRVGYFFGQISWETDRQLLLDSFAKKKGATVRCTDKDCELASDLRPSPLY
jgi:hypothetical protein